MKLLSACILFIGNLSGLLLTLANPARVEAEPKPIATATSTITIKVFKSGLFSMLAHDHTIRGEGLQGLADIGTKPSVSFRLNLRQLKVIDKEVSSKDRAEIQQTMEGEKVLNVSQYPEIRFQSTSVTRQAPDRWQINGNLTLHAITRPISFIVQESGNRYRGKTKLRQRDFGIEPIKIAGGAVRVKDEVEIEFDVALSP